MVVVDWSLSTTLLLIKKQMVCFRRTTCLIKIQTLFASATVVYVTLTINGYIAAAEIAEAD